MTGISPGRAAYEAYCAAMEYVECQPWDDLVPEFQSAMEAAAKAAITAHVPEDWTTMLLQRDDAREQLAGIKDRLESLAADLEMSARTTRPSKKSRIEDGCAAAVLKVLGAPTAVIRTSASK